MKRLFFRWVAWDILVLCIGCAIILSCKSTTDSNLTGTSTTYSYTGKDSSGTVFVTGTLTIPHPDTSSQTGTWKLDSVRGIPTLRFGPQFGTGTWLGGLVTGKILM